MKHHALFSSKDRSKKKYSVVCCKFAWLTCSPNGVYVFQQYKDFHDDLFPDTKCGTPALDASQWFQGQNAKVRWYSVFSQYMSIKSLLHRASAFC